MFALSATPGQIAADPVAAAEDTTAKGVEHAIG